MLNQLDMLSYLPTLPASQGVAVIDIGGNSFELAILTPEPRLLTHKFNLISGKSIGEWGYLSTEAIEVFEKALIEASTLLKQHGVETDHILAVATSGLRDAANGQDMVSLAHQYQIPLKIISGLEESELIYTSVLEALPEARPQSNLVIEIGGGSTELVPGEGSNHPTKALIQVYPWGTGRFGLKDLFDIEKRQWVQDSVQQALSESIPSDSKSLYQSRHTYIKSATEWKGLQQYSLDSGHSDLLSNGLSLDAIQSILTTNGLEKLQKQWRLDYPHLCKLVTKLCILSILLSELQINQIGFGPDWGLKFGLLKQLLSQLAASQNNG